MQHYRGHKSNRVLHLEDQLTILGYDKSLLAFNTVLNEMGEDNGFKRHDGSHYFYHLVDVTQILLNFNVRDDDIIAAALLHDYIEDVDWVTYQHVKMVYGKRVADIVQLVTKDPNIDYKKDISAMYEYLSAIEDTFESALIKTADRIHNFATLLNSSEKHRTLQANETRDLYIPFFKRCRQKHVAYKAFFFHAKTSIEPILGEIERSIKLNSKKSTTINPLRK